MELLGSSITGGLNTVKNAVTGIGTTISNAINGAVNAILDGLKGVLETLFKPSEDYFNDFYQLLISKFPIIDQFNSMITDYVTSLSGFGDERPPVFSITYSGKTMNIFNFAILEPYRATIKTFIKVYASYGFIKWLIFFLPQLFSAGAMAQYADERSKK